MLKRFVFAACALFVFHATSISAIAERYQLVDLGLQA